MWGGHIVHATFNECVYIRKISLALVFINKRRQLVNCSYWRELITASLYFYLAIISVRLPMMVVL